MPDLDGRSEEKRNLSISVSIYRINSIRSHSIFLTYSQAHEAL
jgi:hypothetical protein